MRCVSELGKNVVCGERNEQDCRSRFLQGSGRIRNNPSLSRFEEEVDDVSLIYSALVLDCPLQIFLNTRHFAL